MKKNCFMAAIALVAALLATAPAVGQTNSVSALIKDIASLQSGR